MANLKGKPAAQSFKPGDWVLHVTKGLGEVPNMPVPAGAEGKAVYVRFEATPSFLHSVACIELQKAEAPRAGERDAWQRLIQLGELPADRPYSPAKGKEGYYSKELKRVMSRPVGGLQALEDPSRGEIQKATYTELMEQALAAIRAEDEDTEMAVRAEITGRFKRSDTQISAGLFRLLTKQETGQSGGGGCSMDGLDLDAIEGMDPLVDGAMPANDLGLMYGAKGSGKTVAGLALSFAVIDGTGFLDHSKPTDPGAVLFIASDSGAAPLKAAMQELGVGDHPAVKAGPGRRFHVWAHDAKQGQEAWCASINGCVRLLQFVKDRGVKLVVIDSAKAICAKAGISYLDNDSIAALLTFLKETVCVHASVLILSHDGTEKGSHSGAKVWAEVPSIVHNIQQVPDALQERLWRVVKNRMGPLRELRYQVGEDGGLEVCAGVETIQDASTAVIQVLTEARLRGVPSLSRGALVVEIAKRFQLASKTVDNTLTRMVRATRPEICRVSSPRGHYKLSPRLAERLSPNKVSPNGKEQGKNPVRERVLVTSRGVGSGNSREVTAEFPSSSQSLPPRKSLEASQELESEPVPSREGEMPIGNLLVELFSAGQRIEALDPHTKQWRPGYTVLADKAEPTVKVETPTGKTTNLRRTAVRVA